MEAGGVYSLQRIAGTGCAEAAYHAGAASAICAFVVVATTGVFAPHFLLS